MANNAPSWDQPAATTAPSWDSQGGAPAWDSQPVPAKIKPKSTPGYTLNPFEVDWSNPSPNVGGYINQQEAQFEQKMRGQGPHAPQAPINNPIDYVKQAWDASGGAAFNQIAEDTKAARARFDQRMNAGVPSWDQAAVNSVKDIGHTAQGLWDFGTAPIQTTAGFGQQLVLNKPTGMVFTAAGDPNGQEHADNMWNTAMWGMRESPMGPPRPGFAMPIDTSPFVAGLFGQRGRDTTPPANPIQPIARPTIDASGHTSIDSRFNPPVHDLSNVGDPYHVDTNSYNPQPGLPVHDLTNVSDPGHIGSNYTIPPEGLPVQDLTNPHEPTLTTPRRPESVADADRLAQQQMVEQHIADKTANWKNAPDVTVIHSEDALNHEDPNVARAAKDPANIGVYNADTGKVHIFQDRVESPSDINAVLFHEGLGHFGLAQKFGQGLDSILQSLMDRNVGGFNDKVTTKMEEYGEKSRVRAAEEVLAQMSEQGPVTSKFMDRVTLHVKRFANKMGWGDHPFSDNDVKTILSMAHDAVINGKGRDVRANNFRKGPLVLGSDDTSNLRRMYVGKQAMNHEPTLATSAEKRLDMGLDPESVRRQTGYFRGEDGNIRREISDHRATVRMPKEGQIKRLEDVLQHDKLFAEYPEFRDIPVSTREMPNNWKGAYYPESSYIEISPRAKDPRSVLLHEVQHVVQHFEGHASGGTADAILDRMSDEQLHSVAYDAMDHIDKQINGIHEALQDPNHHPEIKKILEDSVPILEQRKASILRAEDFDQLKEALPKDLKDGLYRRILGEVEARDVQARRNMGEMERAVTPPYSSEPKPSEGYIRINHEGGVSVSPDVDNNRYMRRSDAVKPYYETQSPEDLYHSISQLTPSEKVPWEEQQKRALDAGFSLPEIRKMDDSQLSNTIHRLGSAANMLDSKLRDIRARAGTDAERPNDHATAIKTLAEHLYVLQRLFDNSSEAGRALQILKAFDQYTRGGFESLQALMQEHGGSLQGLEDKNRYLKFMEQLGQHLDAKNVDGVNTMVKQLSKPYWEQYVLSWGYNAMLSSMATHVKKIGNDLSAMVRETAVNATALGVSKIRGLIPGQTDIMHSSELIAHEWGTVKAAFDIAAHRNAVSALAHGVEDTSHDSPIGMKTPDLGVFSLPSRSLHAIAEFFRNFMQTRALYQLGAREAVKALGPGAKMEHIMAEMSNRALNPTVQMLLESKESADSLMKEMTVTQKMKDNMSPEEIEQLKKDRQTAGQVKNTADVQMLVQSPELPFADVIGKARQYRPGMSGMQRVTAFMANLMFPFMRVGANEVFQKLRYMPGIGMLDKTNLADWNAGGQRRDIAIARQIYGGALAVIGWQMGSTLLNKMSGPAPKDYRKELALRAGGYMPDAVKDGNKYVSQRQLGWSINPLDLHNGFMADMAAMRRAWDGQVPDGTKANAKQVALGVAAITKGIIGNTMKQAYIDNIKPYLDDSDTKGALASSLTHKGIPALSNEFAQAGDPYERDTSADTFGGRMKTTAESMIPGQREKLPIRYSVYGEPLKHGKNFFGIHNSQDISQDPTIQELHRLETLVPASVITPAKTTMTIDKQQIKLTPAQHQEYQKELGQTLVNNLRDDIASPQWAQLSDRKKIAYVKTKQQEVIKAVEQDLVGRPGWINDQQRAIHDKGIADNAD